MNTLPKTYEEFLKEIKKNLLIKPEKDGKIREKWSTGGMSGGSCWGDEPEYFSCDEKEPEFLYLDSIIEYYYPKVGFIQYKRLIQELVKYSSDREYCYYGNYDDYSIKEVDLKKLYFKLQEWLEESS